MNITRATRDQAEVVGNLLHAFNTEFGTPTPSVEEFTGRFERLLEREDVLVLLADDAAKRTGFAYLTSRPTPYCDGPLVQLEELYVQPALRNKGIGTELLQEALRRAQDLGSCEVHINVDEVDVDTRRFYQRHGFVNIEPGKDYRMLCYIREF